jgi:hypothetical protein
VRYAPWGPRCRTVRAPDGDITSLDSETVLTALRQLI